MIELYYRKSSFVDRNFRLYSFNDQIKRFIFNNKNRNGRNIWVKSSCQSIEDFKVLSDSWTKILTYEG